MSKITQYLKSTFFEPQAPNQNPEATTTTP